MCVDSSGTSRVLLIDDDQSLCELLIEYLSTEGFALAAAHDGRNGLALALAESWQLIILDVMLPEMDGLEVLRQLRRHSRVPVIMLTARGEEIERIVGLEIGADDYLPKPFNPRELTARMRAVLRRADSGRRRERRQWRVDDFRIDLNTRTAWKNDRLLPLTAMEFKLMRMLMRHPGKVLSREILSEKVLGRELSPFDRSLDVHISNLRKKCRFQESETECIQAVRGEGYVLVGSLK